MDPYTAANRESWDAWTPYHVTSEFYDVAAFKKGRSTLDEVELAGVGEVAGRSLLHLQCHFGLDTLSWARRGARVTGVDLAPRAIAAATALADETGLEARFICRDLYQLDAVLDEQFDIVFSSHGALTWLPDLPAWGRVVARYLAPGGRFFIVDGHPVAMAFSYGAEEPLFRPEWPYFETAPMRVSETGTYAAPDAPIEWVSYEWSYPLSAVVNALIDAGLVIERLDEYPMMAWKGFAFLEQDEAGWWRFPEGVAAIPLMFSVKATKPES